MSALPRLVPLLRVDGTRSQGALLQLADERLVRRVVETWVPELVRHGTDDAAWTWAEKASTVCYTAEVEHVMITHEGDVQGVMITSLPEFPPALSSLPDLLYVEYLAVAPWNRPLAGKDQRFKAIGPFLLAHAVRRSIEKGRQGRIGLHSEPGAISFYERVRLRRCGEDEYLDNHEYFEGDASWAASFLQVR